MSEAGLGANGRARFVLSIVAALLGGLGIVLWIAANWGEWGRVARFGLLQGVVAVFCVAAIAFSRWRAAFALMAFLGIGGLFAYFGQTYQTGADPWQLFAVWALLALPLALAVRSDVLWAPWALVMAVGISLWAHAHAGHRWEVSGETAAVFALAWLAMAAITAFLSGFFTRVTGAGVWALRTAGTLAVVMVAFTALGALFGPRVGMHYWLALALFAAAAVVLSRPRSFEIFLLSAVAFALDALIVAGVARWLFMGRGGDAIAYLFVIGLLAAGVLALSVKFILRCAEAARAGHGETVPVGNVDGDTVPLAVDPGHTASHASAHEPHRPWPVVLLTALGAWLAALPLLVMVGMLLGDVLHRGVGPYVVGALLLGAAAVVLRSRDVGIFLEQLALPALLTGGGTLAFGLFRDLPVQVASLLLCGVALGMAFIVHRAWLQLLLGAAACSVAMGVFLPDRLFDAAFAPRLPMWFALHGTLVLGAAAVVWNARQRDARIGAIATGWLLLLLAGLAMWAGMTFLVGGIAGPGLAGEWGAMPGARGGIGTWVPMAGSVICAALACARWPRGEMNRSLGWTAVLVALIALVLAAFMPTLGGALLVLAWAVSERRWRMAGAAAFAALWIVGAFYYALQWPLTVKALVLVACGATFAVAVRLGPPRVQARHASASSRAAIALIATSALLVLVAINHAIRQKETLIATGEKFFVRLAPVDPRSLMQGDFMRLNYTMPGGAEKLPLAWGRRPYVVARRDARGVAQLVRIEKPGDTPAPGESRIELTPVDGRWFLVSDAWHFREGDGARWAAARYGEFRVAPDGRALLVGLANEQLQPIAP